ncbi:hypothetical protein D3C80_1187280 [compost metagenome]
MAAAAGEAAADQLAGCRIACSIQSRNAGAAVFIRYADAAGSAHRTFQPQCNWESILERINAPAVKRQEKVRLGNPQQRLQIL